MSLLLIAPNRNLTKLEASILEIDAGLTIEVWPEVKNKDRVQFAVCWNHPKHVLGQYPNLKAVSSLGAGVNHLLDDESLSDDVPICRIVTPGLKEQMSDYLLGVLLNHQFHLTEYAAQQKKATWEVHSNLQKSRYCIGIMGLGEMGLHVAKIFIKNGYDVRGWAKSKKELDGLASYTGDRFNEFLKGLNVLICLLPLTNETEHILDLDVFQQLEKGAYLINVGRGSHLVEEDLIYALDTGRLSGACLDVFEKEPLPGQHTFWNRPNILITPHIAAITPHEEAAELIVENYKRVISGMNPLHKINRDSGY